MKAIKITTDNKVSTVNLNEPVWQDIALTIDGYFEVVRANYRKWPREFVILCDDNGLNKHLPFNHIASELYGYSSHGNPIVGDILIMKEGMTDEGPDFVDLTERDICQIGQLLKTYFHKNTVEEVMEKVRDQYHELVSAGQEEEAENLRRHVLEAAGANPDPSTHN